MIIWLQKSFEFHMLNYEIPKRPHTTEQVYVGMECLLFFKNGYPNVRQAFEAIVHSEYSI